MVDVTLTLSHPDDLPSLIQTSTAVDDCDWSSDFLKKLCDNGNLFTLWSNGTISGFIAQSVVLNEAELLQIAVGAPYQGHGLGREALNQWLIGLQAQKINKVFLEVRENNHPARALYRSQFFKTVGTRKNYYRDNGINEDAIILSLNL